MSKKLEESTEHKICEDTCCNHEKIDYHLCPFKADINGDYETICNCCESCIQVCCDEI